MDRGAWRATVHWVAESDTTEHARAHAPPPPSLLYEKTCIQTLVRWLLQDVSLPSSQSDGSPNKVIFLVSMPCL